MKLEDQVKPGCVEAMEALFALHDAIQQNGLTIADIEKVVRLAVAQGIEGMELTVAMASIAVGKAARK